MKKQVEHKLDVMRSVVRDLSNARGGAINNTNTSCAVGGTKTRDRGNDQTWVCPFSLRF